jgi:hypothetical protein
LSLDIEFACTLAKSTSTKSKALRFTVHDADINISQRLTERGENALSGKVSLPRKVEGKGKEKILGKFKR